MYLNKNNKQKVPFLQLNEGQLILMPKGVHFNVPLFPVMAQFMTEQVLCTTTFARSF